MTDERTPLLSSAVIAGPSGISRASRLGGWTLAGEVEILLRPLRSRESPGGPGTAQSSRKGEVPEDAGLAVLLYALQTLSRPKRPTGSVRARIAKVKKDLAIQEVLLEEVERLLDGESHDVGLEDGDVVSEMDSDVDSSRRLFWSRWDTGNGARISAMELLLPPHAKSSSPFLSHPMVRYQLEQAWRYGVSDEREAPRLGMLARAITPRRAHILHLASLLAWIGLTLAIAISPRSWISPYDIPEDPPDTLPRPTGLEIVWIIWTIDIIRNLSLVPSILALPVVLSLLTLGTPATTYTLITSSVPLLTIIVIIPTYPSIPLLFTRSATLPLSTLLLSTLNRSLRPLALLLPVLVLALALFSWAINGDPFRAFYILSAFACVVLTVGKVTLNVDPMIEEGVAPFQIRLSLFVTLCMILLIGLTLGFARSALPSPVVRGGGVDEGRRWRGDVMEEDDWEKDYGVIIGRRARKRFGEAVLGGLGLDRRWTTPGPPSRHRRDADAAAESAEAYVEESGRIDVLCPLDLVIVPLDVVIALTRLLRRISAKRAVGEADQTRWRVRQSVATVLMGPLCLLLSSLGI